MFVPSIAMAQQGDCSKFTITDNSDFSTEPKAGFSSRTLQLLDGYGNPYTPAGFFSPVISWPLSQNSIDIPVDQDYAFQITYTINPVTPVSGSTYTKDFYAALACNLRVANGNLIASREIDQDTINLDSYRDTLTDIQIEYMCAQRSIQSGDIIGSQKALDRGIGIYNDYAQNPGM
jgi:hypothetical protein